MAGVSGRVASLLLAALAGVGCQGPVAFCEVGPPDDAASAGAEALAPADMLVVVGEEVHLSAGESVGEAFTWDLGDGTELEGPEVSHAWTEAGSYLVKLTAAGAPPDSDSLHVTVVNVPLAVPPVQSGRLVSDGARLFAALPDFDQVAVVGLAGGAAAAEVHLLDVCEEPVSLATDGALLAVACRHEVQLYSGELELEDTVDGGAAAVLLQEGLQVLRTDGRLEGPSGEAEALRGRQLVGWTPDEGEGLLATARFSSPEEHGEWWRSDEAVPRELTREPGPDSDTNARGVPNLLQAGAVRPDGGVVVWGGLKSNTERGLYVEGTELEHDNVVRSVLKVVDLHTGEELEAPLFDNRDRVGAVAWTPLGDRLLVAHHGARTVDVLDGLTMQRVGGWQDVGWGLDGLWTDGEVAWVLASLDRQLVAFDLAAGNAQVELARLELVEEEVLSEAELLGAQLFHAAGDRRMSVDGYISCGSCHPDGGEDGRVWDFTQRGEGLRNTLPIWAMPEAGPWHWSANFDELQDFENDIRLHQSGEGYLDEEDWAECADPLGTEKAGRSEELDALAAYMQHLRRTAAPVPAYQPEALDLAPFQAAGCDTCHAGPELTDAAWVSVDEPLLHDVGTLTEASGGRLGGELSGLRTPGLRGVAWTAPYLHDGSAETLEEAILAHEGVSLSEEELAELVEILRTF